jgi:hypothetical protein
MLFGRNDDIMGITELEQLDWAGTLITYDANNRREPRRSTASVV